MLCRNGCHYLLSLLEGVLSSLVFLDWEEGFVFNKFHDDIVWLVFIGNLYYFTSIVLVDPEGKIGVFGLGFMDLPVYYKQNQLCQY